jgi:hypothetical protein
VKLLDGSKNETVNVWSHQYFWDLEQALEHAVHKADMLPIIVFL